jgi:hypothetical protein
MDSIENHKFLLMCDPQRYGGSAGLLRDPQRYGGICHSTTDASAALLSFFVSLQNVSEKLTFCLKTKKCSFWEHRLCCDPAGIRTQDPILKRDVLYLLSY